MSRYPDDTEPSYIPYGMGAVDYMDGARIKHFRARYGSGNGREQLGYFSTRQEAEQVVLRRAMKDIVAKYELCKELYLAAGGSSEELAQI